MPLLISVPYPLGKAYSEHVAIKWDSIRVHIQENDKVSVLFATIVL